MPKKAPFLVRLRKWAGWWLAACGAATLAVGFGFVIWTSVFLIRATETAGRIVQTVPVSSDEGRTTNFAPVFTFSIADGHSFTITSNTSSNPPEFEPGDRVKVLYIPSHPENARLKSTLQLWLAPLICVPLSLFYILFGGVLLYFDRRYRRRIGAFKQG